MNNDRTARHEAAGEARGTTLQLFENDGTPVDAHFHVKRVGERWDLYFHSRGGKIGEPNARNVQYARGLGLLVDRFTELALTIGDGFVETINPFVRELGEDQRRLTIEGLKFPVRLATGDEIGEVVRLLRRAQADVGSNRDQGGGNTTRQIRLVLEGPDELKGIPNLGVLLSSGLFGRLTMQLVEASAGPFMAREAFSPNNMADARRWVVASIALRQGQQRFRRALLNAYDFKCAISHCDVEAVLEAAHIIPYAGEWTNHPQNGLLLRADLHTLFDFGLLGIDPSTWTVVLSSDLLATQYGNLHGLPVRLPENSGSHPDQTALLRHLSAAGLQRIDT